jgi:hypothetical protein
MVALRHHFFFVAVHSQPLPQNGLPTVPVIREPSADWFDILFDASSLLTQGSQISRKAASALIDRLNAMSPQNGNRNADHQHRYRKQN